jgi:hypothetical protein
LGVEEIGPEELTKYDPGRLMFVNVNTPHYYARAMVFRRSAGGAKADGDRITDVHALSSRDRVPHST